MKKIINFLLNIFVLWGASKLLTNTVQFSSNTAIVLSALTMFIMGWLLMAALLPLLLGSGLLLSVNNGKAQGAGCLTFILIFTIALISTPIRLWLTGLIVPGFTIHGFWTYVLISVALCIFNLSDKKK